jgi:nucleoredoxin
LLFIIFSLLGKQIGLYFSAHWCGPCRNFTPKLAAKYKEIVAEGHPFEIIFISSDQDEESAMKYYDEMPWLMLTFGNEAADLLSTKFSIQGIPTLILLDAEGNTITNNGRTIIMEVGFDSWKSYAEQLQREKEEQERQLAELKANFNIVNFFSTRKVLDNQGKEYSADHFTGKLIGIYFSAHWCPPCRRFTPRLAERYRELSAQEKAFEVIFVSSDRSQEAANEYFAEMPWKMLDYSDRKSSALLGECFDVSGIPTLVLLNENGIITDNGTEVILTVPVDEIPEYLKKEKEEKERKQKEYAELWPATLKIEAHEHELEKRASVYRGGYGCDVCGSLGEGYVYHCDECGFDVHPQCTGHTI